MPDELPKVDWNNQLAKYAQGSSVWPQQAGTSNVIYAGNTAGTQSYSMASLVGKA